jgi:hypothetical protein
MLSLLSVGLFVIAAPIPAPKGPPPQVEFAYVDKTGSHLVFTRRGVQTREVHRGTVAGGDVPSIEEVKAVTLSFVPLTDKDVHVYGPNGNRLTPNEVQKVMVDGANVLLSTDGKPIHPLHMAQHRDIKYWVVTPPGMLQPGVLGP